MEKIRASQDRITWSLGAIKVIQVIRNHIPSRLPFTYSILYAKILAGDPDMAATLRELLVLTRKSSSDVLFSLLSSITDIITGLNPGDKEVCPNKFVELRDQLDLLIKDAPTDAAPLRSAHDLRNETLRTTIVSKKIEMSKRKSQLSKQEGTYSEILSTSTALIETYFESAIAPMSDIYLHEILFYDLKLPHRDVFNPRPTTTVERALSAPHDYLSCTCCSEAKVCVAWFSASTTDTLQDELAPTLPATAILYKLYLESGALINASDLWSAFQATTEDRHGDEQTAMSLFQRSLAELKYMGFLKQSRKKTDHLAKLAWKGI